MNPTDIKALILIGGKSSRMGTDKSELNYHGKPQKDYLKNVLENLGLEVFFSVAKETKEGNEIVDINPNLGPIGGIFSAFQKDSNAAWLVLATDLPFVDKEVVQLLLTSRNPTKIVTSLKGKNKDFPEPLITIYEPRSFPILRKSIESGVLSPHNILANSDIEIIEVEDRLLVNVNTSEEFEKVKKELKS